MKKIYTLMAGLTVAISAVSQTFTDDFESYTVGQYIGTASANWTTWSGTNGGADDVQIVNTQSNSGTKSIYFEASSSAGGPDDIVLPFGAAYTTGIFNYKMSLLMDAGTGSYFNFQAETTVGQVWALETTINESGGFNIGNTDGTLLTGVISDTGWLDIEFNINLDQNEWDFIVNGISEGTFSNTVNKIASINIYAYNGTNGGNGLARFWVDDVSYEYTSTTLPSRNGAVFAVAPINGLVGQSKLPSVTVRNLGNDNITSFDLTVDYDGGQMTESVSGLNLASYEDYTVDFTTALALVAGSNNLTATISKVNGNSAPDDDPTDDSKSITVAPTSPGLHKRVVVEEGTGTWCGWCPRGAVWMAYMQEEYPDHFIGIAVHNGDPMTNTDYDAGLGTLISGYPSALVDRGPDIDPSDIEPNFMDRVVLDAAAELCHSATLNETTGELTVNMRIVLNSAVTSNWKVAMVLTENGVTGTASTYAQANYYSGGASGELVGAGHSWHLEGNPVPASQMVYDHVARIIAPSFTGLTGVFSSGGSSGEVFNAEFTATLDGSWNNDNIHVITMLMDENGVIDNGHQTSLDEALETVCGPLGLVNAQFVQPKLEAFPNPTSNSIQLTFSIVDAESSAIVVRDMSGRIVYAQDALKVGLQTIDLDLSLVNSGLYMVELRDAGTIATKRIVKQ